MFDYIKGILKNGGGSEGQAVNSKRKLQIATCALFIEIARADNDFTNTERNIIIDVMKNSFELDDDEVIDLIHSAEESVNKSVSVYEFTRLIDESINKDEKYELLKNLWRLIYSDKLLDKYEDNLIKKIGDMLKMELKDVINAKLFVKEELGINS